MSVNNVVTKDATRVWVFIYSFLAVLSKAATRGVPKKFSKFTGKHLCQSLLFNKVAGLGPATLLTKRLWCRCFPVSFREFLRTPFLTKPSVGPCKPSITAPSCYFCQKNSITDHWWDPKYTCLPKIPDHFQKQSSVGVLKNFTKFTGKQLCQNTSGVCFPI